MIVTVSPSCFGRLGRGWVGLGTLATALGLTLALAWLCGISLNLSPSAPMGLWRPSLDQRTPLLRGDEVSVCLPSAWAEFAKERNYISSSYRGDCAGHYEPVLKRVLGVPGDVITISANGMEVNGVAIPDTRPLARDERGRSLTQVPDGKYFVPWGQLWLVGSADVVHSLDSRYFGLVPIANVKWRMISLLTWEKRRH